MGWRSKLKQFVPVALDIAGGNYIGGAMELVNVVHNSPEQASPEKASIDTVRVVAASTDDNAEQIKALTARLEALESAQKY